jgi:hypothetical protein
MMRFWLRLPLWPSTYIVQNSTKFIHFDWAPTPQHWLEHMHCTVGCINLDTKVQALPPPFFVFILAYNGEMALVDDAQFQRRGLEYFCLLALKPPSTIEPGINFPIGFIIIVFYTITEITLGIQLVNRYETEGNWPH